jgi:hypothetical protein
MQKHHMRLLAVGLVAGAVLLVYGRTFLAHWLGLFPVFTAEGYETWARQWIFGNGLNPDIFRHSLAIHVWISTLFFISNASVIFVYVMQAALVVLACIGLAHWASRRISGPWGWWSGMLCACFGPLLFSSFQFGPGVWAFVGCVALMIGFDVLEQRRQPAVALMIGLLIGVLGLFHPALWAAGIGAWGALRVSRMVRSSTNEVPHHDRHLWFGLALAILPLLVIYYTQTGVPTIFPVSDAASLYLPNHDGSCESRYPRPGLQQERFSRWLRMNDAVTPREQRAFILRQVWTSVRTEPGVWLRAIRDKGGQILCGREPGGEVSPYVAHEYSRLQRWLFWSAGGFGFPWALLMSMACVGLMLRGRSWPAWLHGLWLGYVLAGMLFSVTSSYRLGLLPVVAAATVAAADAIAAMIRRRAWRMAGAVILLAGGLAYGFSLLPPLCPGQLSDEAGWRVGVAQRLLHAGRMDEAELLFREAVGCDPENPMGLNGLANVELARGDDDAAESWLRQAVTLAPDYSLAWFNLAVIERDRGQAEAAIGALRRGLLFHPWRGQAHFDLGRLLDQTGAHEQAMEHYEIAMQLDPDVPAPALAYAQGQYEAGQIESVMHILRGRPMWLTTVPEWSFLYARALFAEGRYHDALVSYLLVLDMGYAPELVHEELADAYEALDNHEQAAWHRHQAALLSGY